MFQIDKIKQCMLLTNGNQSDDDYNQSDDDYNQSDDDYNQSDDDYNQSDDDYNQSDDDYNQSDDDYNQSDGEKNQSDDDSSDWVFEGGIDQTPVGGGLNKFHSKHYVEKYKGGHIWVTAGLSRRKPKLGDRAFFTLDNRYDIEPNTTEPNTTEPNTTEPNTTEPNTTEPNTTGHVDVEIHTEGEDSDLEADNEYITDDEAEYEYQTYDDSDYDSDDYEGRKPRKRKEVVEEPIIVKPPLVLLDPEVSKLFNERTTVSLIKSAGNLVIPEGKVQEVPEFWKYETAGHLYPANPYFPSTDYFVWANQRKRVSYAVKKVNMFLRVHIRYILWAYYYYKYWSPYQKNEEDCSTVKKVITPLYFGGVTDLIYPTWPHTEVNELASYTVPGDGQQEFGDLSDNVHDDLSQVWVTQTVHQYSHLWDLPISMGCTSSLVKKNIYIDPKPKFRLNVKTTFKTDLIATEDLDHDSDEFKERVRKDVSFYTVLPDRIKTDAKKQSYLEDDFEKRCVALYNLKVGKHLLGRPGKYRLASLLFRKAREDYPEYFRKYRNKVSERFVNWRRRRERMLVEYDNPHQKKPPTLPYTIDFLDEKPIFYRNIKDFTNYKKYAVYQFVIKNKITDFLSDLEFYKNSKKVKIADSLCFIKKNPKSIPTADRIITASMYDIPYRQVRWAFNLPQKKLYRYTKVKNYKMVLKGKILRLRNKKRGSDKKSNTPAGTNFIFRITKILRHVPQQNIKGCNVVKKKKKVLFKKKKYRCGVKVTGGFTIHNYRTGRYGLIDKPNVLPGFDNTDSSISDRSAACGTGKFIEGKKIYNFSKNSLYMPTNSTALIQEFKHGSSRECLETSIGIANNIVTTVVVDYQRQVTLQKTTEGCIKHDGGAFMRRYARLVGTASAGIQAPITLVKSALGNMWDSRIYLDGYMYYKIKRQKILVIALENEKELLFKKACIIQKKDGIVETIVKEIDMEVIWAIMKVGKDGGVKNPDTLPPTKEIKKAFSIYKYGLKAMSEEHSNKTIVKESIDIVDNFIGKIKPDELKDLFYIGTEYRIFMVGIVVRYLTKLHKEQELQLPPSTRPVDKISTVVRWDHVPKSNAPEILMSMKTAEAWSEMATNYLVKLMQNGRVYRYLRHKKLKHSVQVAVGNKIHQTRRTIIW